MVSAIKEMMKRGQPYIGAFLLKDENADSDIITDIESVHRVGVFAQITSVFPANASSSPTAGTEDTKDESLTVVLYPHRRIRINELQAPSATSSISSAKIEEVKEESAVEPVEPVAAESSEGEQTVATQTPADQLSPRKSRSSSNSCCIG